MSHSLLGVAPGEAAQSQATELAPETVGAGPLTAIKTRVVITGRLGGLPGRHVLLVKFPSGGFGLSNAKIAGLPGAQNGFHSPMALHSGGLERSKNPCIQLLLPPAL